VNNKKFDIKRFANQVAGVDDLLGSFSDYEGDENGPTMRLFHAGKERWERRCQEAIDLHLKAAQLWEKALKASKEQSR